MALLNSRLRAAAASAFPEATLISPLFLFSSLPLASNDLNHGHHEYHWRVSLINLTLPGGASAEGQREPSLTLSSVRRTPKYSKSSNEAWS